MALTTAAKIFIQVVVAVASIAYQQNQQKKLKARLQSQQADNEKHKGMKITRRGESYNIPVAYGRAALGGLETRHKISNSFIYDSGKGDYQFEVGSNWNSGIGGSKKEFLLTQAVIAHEGINRVLYINTNDSPYDKVEKSEEDSTYKKVFDQATYISTTGGTPLGVATANGVESTAKFTKCSHATSFYRLNRDDPQYSGFPDNTYFLEGQKVYDVILSGGVYSLSSTKTYSNNPSLVLLDYLTNSVYGLNLTEDEVDLESFYNAKNICDTIVSTNRLIGGRVHGHKPITNYPSQSYFPSEGSIAYYYKADDTEAYYEWNTSTSTYDSISKPSRNIPLFECNIVIDTSATIRDNINRILNTMLGADLTWSSLGKYKIHLEYPTSNADLEALVNSEHYFTEDDIIRETVDIAWPSAEDRLNQVTCTFNNEHEDFKQDSVTWPKTGSSVHNTYLSEDNNRPMTKSLTLDGITDPYHALARAESLVRKSRSTKTLSLTLSKKGLSLEPGDFIKINSNVLAISNDVYRVLKVQVSGDLTAKIEAEYLDPDALAWNVNDDIAYKNPEIYDFRVRGPNNVTTSSGNYISSDGSLFNSINVNWDAAEDTSVKQYEVQYKKSTDSSYNSSFTRETTYEIVNVEANVQYDIRVRAITALGITSSFATSTGTNTGKDIDPNPPSGLTVTGSFQILRLSYNLPTDKDLNQIEIRESVDNSFSNSVLSGFSDSTQYIRSGLSNNQTLYFWIRSVDNSGRTSSWVGPVSGTTDLIPTGSFDSELQEVLDTAQTRSIANTSVTGNYTDEIAFNLADNRLYRWTGSSWSSTLYVAIEDNSITETKINNDSVTTNKIAANSIIADKIATGAVTSDKVLANAIIASKIASGAISADKIAANAVISDKIAANAIISDKISAGSITGPKLADGSVGSVKIASAAITTAKIDNLAITTAKIGNNQVTFPSSTLGSSGVLVSNSSGEVTAASLSVNGTGANALVQASVSITHVNSGGTGTAQNEYATYNINLYKNSGVLVGYTNAYVGDINFTTVILPDISYSSGTHTYYLKVQKVGGTATYIKYFNPVITYLELKK